uniref:Uncharacterized protein n=1 Tax=Neisseria meningitidis alpha275 TaxID=295996 RepID=C6SMV6_NEIME|nr:hypothetical protein predicted by Glimmer/Critica [Neisseria meningitidis alpha275]
MKTNQKPKIPSLPRKQTKNLKSHHCRENKPKT